GGGPRSRSLSRTATRRVWSALAVLAALVWVFPVYWIVNSAFQTPASLRAPNPPFLPTARSFDSFRRALDEQFFASLRLSLTVTLVVVVAAGLFAFLGAVGLSRCRFRGRVSFLLVVLTIQVIPPEALFISQYKMLEEWGLYSTVPGLSLLYVAAVIPFTVWLLRG